MSKKNNNGGLVYSTNKNIELNHQDEEQMETLPPSKQRLKVMIDKKNRGGKTVTLITGFVGSENDLESLSKKIKNYCGTGGSAKDGEIIIQGEQKEKVIAFLLKEGYQAK